MHSKYNRMVVFLCLSYFCEVVLCILIFWFVKLNLFNFSESEDKYENLREEKQKPLLPGYQNSTCPWVGSEGEGNYIILIVCFLDLFEFAFCSLEFSTNWCVIVHSYECNHFNGVPSNRLDMDLKHLPCTLCLLCHLTMVFCEVYGILQIGQVSMHKKWHLHQFWTCWKLH